MPRDVLCVSDNKLKYVKQKLKLKAKTREELARELNIGRQAIINFFLGRNVDAVFFRSICEFLNVQWTEVVEIYFEGALYNPKIYLSCSIAKISIINLFKDFCKSYNLFCFCPVVDLQIGKNIQAYRRENLKKSDYLIIVLSDEGQHRIDVSDELEIALEMHRIRNDLRPYIIGVLEEDLSSQSLIFQLSNGADYYNFSNYRCLQLDKGTVSRDISNLLKDLIPRVTFITNPIEQRDLFDASILCYEELFPDIGERDDPNDINTWLIEEYCLPEVSSPFKDIYAVLHLMEEVIGMAYFSYPISESWCFGDYFGIKYAWRGENRALMLFQTLYKELNKKKSLIKGIVFEIDPVDIQFIKKIVQRGTLFEADDRDEVIKNLKALRRLCIFQANGARIFLHSSTTPLKYVQPALSEPLIQDNERVLFLMVYCFDKTERSSISLKEILDFVYDAHLKPAHDINSNAYIPGFDDYVDDIRKQQELPEGEFILGTLPVSSREVSILMRMVKDEGISEDWHL